jgi:hypothetical protein
MACNFGAVMFGVATVAEVRIARQKGVQTLHHAGEA